jgi:hypothetical protein
VREDSDGPWADQYRTCGGVERTRLGRWQTVTLRRSYRLHGNRDSDQDVLGALVRETKHFYE